MNGIFNDGNPFETGYAADQGDQQRAAQIASAQVAAADAQRKAQADIALDQATRGALRSVGYGAATPDGMPAQGATAAPPAPAPAASVATAPPPTALAGASGPVSTPGVGVTPPPQAPAAAPSTALPAAPTGFSPIQRAAQVRGALTNAYAATPGGGQPAAGMAFQDIAAQQEVMHRVFQMAETDPQMAENFATQAGMPMPPQLRGLIEDRATRQRMLQIFDDASKIYPNERDAVQKQQYIRGQLQVMTAAPQPGMATQTPQAQAAAALPEPRPPKPDYPIQPVTTMSTDASGNLTTHIGTLDPNSGEVRDTGVGGVAPRTSLGAGFFRPDGTVMVGQNSGKLYRAGEQGDAGEPVIPMRTQDAVRYADARGNQQTRLLITQMQGQTQRDVAGTNATARTAPKAMTVLDAVREAQRENPGADPADIDKRATQIFQQQSQGGYGQPAPAPSAPQAAGDGRTPQTPSRPQSQDDFNKLPSGAYFINPADGRVLRKR